MLGRLIEIMPEETVGANILTILREFQKLTDEFEDSSYGAAGGIAFYSVKSHSPKVKRVQYAAYTGKLLADRGLRYANHGVWEPEMHKYIPKEAFIRDPIAEKCLELFHACLGNLFKIICNDEPFDSKEQSLENLKDEAEKLTELFINIKNNRQFVHNQDVLIERESHSPLEKTRYGALLSVNHVKLDKGRYKNWTTQHLAYILLLECYLNFPVNYKRKFQGEREIEYLKLGFGIQKKLSQSQVMKESGPVFISKEIRKAKRENRRIDSKRIKAKCKELCDQFNKERGLSADGFAGDEQPAKVCRRSESYAERTPPNSPKKNTVQVEVITNQLSATTFTGGPNGKQKALLFANHGGSIAKSARRLLFGGNQELNS